MSYPLVIKDNFFSDPDSIARLSKEVEYSNSENTWPGSRSGFLHKINLKLYAYIGQQIIMLIHDRLPTTYNLETSFQKINPYVRNDKWNKKNRGWVHKDYCLFGGIIYLDRNPDKDSGTSIYKSKDGYDVQTAESLFYKEELYNGNEVDDVQYDKSYDILRDQYEETLRIPNLYNRLVLIPGDQWHSMTTTGDKERHTIVFFCHHLEGVFPPEYKKGQSVSIPNHELYT